MAQDTSVGQRLREARKALGLSQLSAASRCGWDSQTRISMYELGRRSPDYRDLAKLAAAYGVRQEWILTGQEPARAGATPLDSGIQSAYSARPITLAGTARLRPGGTWQGIQPEDAPGDLTIQTPTDDPDGYLIQIDGPYLRPAIRDGEVLTIEPNKPLVPGEMVLITTSDGLTQIMELLYERNRKVTLGGINDANEQIVVERDEIVELAHIGPRLPASAARQSRAESA